MHVKWVRISVNLTYTRVAADKNIQQQNFTNIIAKCSHCKSLNSCDKSLLLNKNCLKMNEIVSINSCIYFLFKIQFYTISVKVVTNVLGSHTVLENLLPHLVAVLEVDKQNRLRLCETGGNLSKVVSRLYFNTKQKVLVSLAINLTVIWDTSREHALFVEDFFNSFHDHLYVLMIL